MSSTRITMKTSGLLKALGFRLLTSALKSSAYKLVKVRRGSNSSICRARAAYQSYSGSEASNRKTQLSATSYALAS